MIIFIRHGQTKENVEKINTGRRNVPLNKKGKIQSKECAQIMMWERIDVVYCSPLKRARQTAKYIMKHHKGTPIFYDDRLLEREDGAATGRKRNEVFISSAWDFKLNYQIENFEQLPDMFKRISDFYDEILEKHKGQRVVVVAHDGVGKMSRMYFEGLPQNKTLDGYIFDNARPYVLGEKYNKKER